MATVKSPLITNFEAGTRPDAREFHGNVRTAMATDALGTGDIDDDDEFHLVPVPMNARIVSIKVFNDDLDGHACPTLAANLGLYYGGDNGLDVTRGDVIDEDCYATAITTLQAANTSGVELAFEVRDIANVGQEVWEDGGLSSNPGGFAYIGFKVSTAAATAAAGDVTLVVQYVVD